MCSNGGGDDYFDFCSTIPYQCPFFAWNSTTNAYPPVTVCFLLLVVVLFSYVHSRSISKQITERFDSVDLCCESLVANNPYSTPVDFDNVRNYEKCFLSPQTTEFAYYRGEF